ncbi:MAG: hypothetical protein GY708_30475 [Actinomycetia bacterium]|nr:hypothetical protein [Actinomycetes bacterium]MCP4962311.1 hypothetical protein [Actinomycetes bacterium]
MDSANTPPVLIDNLQYSKWSESILRQLNVGQAHAVHTTIFLGLQNPSPIEDNLGLIEICHTLGIRFIQLT